MNNFKSGKESFLCFFMVLAGFFVFGLVFPLYAFAQTSSENTTPSFTYTPLEKIPGFESETSSAIDFPRYMEILFNILLWSVGIAALFMIIVGGFWYLTAAGNTSQLEQAKEIIKDSIIGLLVAFFSWLLLYVINPDLVRLDLSSLTTLKMSGGQTGGQAGKVVGGGTDTGGTVGTGDCSGYTLSGPTCANLSGSLQTFLTCLRNKVPSNISMTITSITSNAIGSDLEKSKSCCASSAASKPSYCPHSPSSCHHGCNTSNPGYSYAVDIAMTAGNPNYCTIAEAAVSCGAQEKYGPKTACGVSYYTGHSTHFHFSSPGCT